MTTAQIPTTIRDDAYMLQHEHIPTSVYETSSEVSIAVAAEIADLIRSKAAAGETCVLGLATGSTPVSVYNELIRLHKDEGLSFANVVTFNLDEYFPMLPNELQSYVRFMNENLFDHIDIPEKNVNIPDGRLTVQEVFDHCQNYEQKIRELGGIDLQLLGIGRTGHIGFNEPGSSKESRTRLITLDRVTRMDAASDFFGEENVPRRAVTMGVGTILDARRVILMAFGEGKAPVVAHAVEGEVTSVVAASFLQDHDNAVFCIDHAAAAQLIRFSCPWLLGPIKWTDKLIRKAVIWLARKVDKPILKLTDEDYNEAGLQDLLATQGQAYDINIDIFRDLQDTITGWPAGKPADAKYPGVGASGGRRESDEEFPKRILIFSPHPDDDVISMGGTFIRLVDQGHEVHVAYQTSGNIAVFDEDAIRFADFFGEFNKLFEISEPKSQEIEAHIETFLKNKQPGQVDSEIVQQLKGLIRRGEARAACRCVGIPQSQIHFMDMPFYETGRVRKKPLGAEDVNLTVKLLEEIKPHQVYAAGDLSDPHGTHRTCLRAIFKAMDEVKERDWAKNCDVWLYRGAWQEWEPEEIEMAVPLSPQELMRKRVAIFKHESQKDRALFPGHDVREFWQRAEDRNRATANIYDSLGLAEYEGIEAFVQWDGDVSSV